MTGRATIAHMHLREATEADLDLLYDMLLKAFNWDGTQRFTRDQVIADEHTARYVGGWGRSDDFGLVAVDGDELLGAIWARALPATRPGYGYVADDVPEIGLGVAQPTVAGAWVPLCSPVASSRRAAWVGGHSA